jgi:hypothetical protein
MTKNLRVKIEIKLKNAGRVRYKVSVIKSAEHKFYSLKCLSRTKDYNSASDNGTHDDNCKEEDQRAGRRIGDD